jgi:hypothetical protein
MAIDHTPARKTPSLGRLGQTLGLIGAWAWAIFASGGGFLFLLEKGSLPSTNRWLALLSGISACPLTACLLKRFAGVAVSVWVRFVGTAFSFVAGKMAFFLGM